MPGVLFVHGWGGTQEQYLNRAREIAALGCVCLTIDLRGHGDNQEQYETVTREDNLRDMLAAYDMLAGHHAADPSAIAVVGSSYGGYLATILSSLRPVRWLALRAPALYRDEDWNLPKWRLNKEELAAYRQTRVTPGPQPRAGGLRRLQGRRAAGRVRARQHRAPSRDRQLQGGLRQCPLAHIPRDPGRRPCAVRRTMAAVLHLPARQMGDGDGHRRAGERKRSRRRTPSPPPRPSAIRLSRHKKSHFPPALTGW